MVMNYNKWIKLNTCDLTNKTAVITGSTGGLGNELCKMLANLNCNLVLINRNIQKSEKQKAELSALNPNIEISIIQLDLSKIEQVKIATEQLKTIKFDYLIHNAGVYNIPLEQTTSGFNNIFTTNFVSPYYFTSSLVEHIKNINAKVVAVSSIAHNYSKIDEKDIDFSKHKKPSKIYGNSKRFLTFSLMKLFEENQYQNYSICHPGITLTNMTNHYPKAINWLAKVGIKLLFPSPKKACLNIVKSLFENTSKNEWIGPKIFNIWGKPKKKQLNTCKNEEIEKIYPLSQNIYEKLQKNWFKYQFFCLHMY